MNRFKYFIASILFSFAIINFNAQEFELLNKKKSYSMSFKLINNLIIIPLEINDVEFTFILDSGVSTPVLFNLKPSDSLKINNLSVVQVRGLGAGNSLDALYSKNNNIKLGNLYAKNQDLFLIYNDKLDLSTKLGITIHGLIGYDILKDFVVTINYISRKISFTKPEFYKYKKCKNCETFDMEFYKNKPYIMGQIISQDDNIKRDVKLLIDLGGTDSLWLFENNEISIPKKSFEDFIGEGISGSIYGMRSKLKSFQLKSFLFEFPNVAYLDSINSFYATKFKSRNGSLGGNILKRFKITLDYPNKKITLKKNSNYKQKFKYNMSGIELVYDGKILVKELNYANFQVEGDAKQSNKISFSYNYKFNYKPIYKVSYVRKNSPAYIAGVKKEDVITHINGKRTYNYNIQDITNMFQKKENKLIKIRIKRGGLLIELEFKLIDVLKKSIPK